LKLILGRCGVRLTPGLCGSGRVRRSAHMNMIINHRTPQDIGIVLARASGNILDWIGSAVVFFKVPSFMKLVVIVFIYLNTAR
jgi:hypothetical protein